MPKTMTMQPGVDVTMTMSDDPNNLRGGTVSMKMSLDQRLHHNDLVLISNVGSDSVPRNKEESS
jgi:hypothetical protein